LHIDFDIEIEKDYERGEAIIRKAVTAIYKKKRKPVVLLIDECDRLVIETVDQSAEIRKSNENYLRALYAPIKDLISKNYIHFSLLLGISCFDVSQGSTNNNLVDITFNEEYNNILGITLEEIKDNKRIFDEMNVIVKEKKTSFEEEIKRIEDFYDGFRWFPDATKLINTNALMRYLESHGEIDFYFTNSTTTLTLVFSKFNFEMLSKMLVEYISVNVKELNISSEELYSYLFFSGYFTVLGNVDKNTWKVGFPNSEVRAFYIKNWLKNHQEYTPNVIGIVALLEDMNKENISAILGKFNQTFENLHYCITNEAEFQSTMYIIFLQNQAMPRLEAFVKHGYIDMIYEDKNYINIMEFKYNLNADKVIQQIFKNKYYSEYLEESKTKNKLIRLFGINYESAKRRINSIIVYIQSLIGKDKFCISCDKTLML